ncbi:cupin domain-containing protein [Natronosalvus rutilus]|uniref:Cupin domain-containing protein n=1 Tax=Natronosalvus rutilus TaxID=2953753 RepID=A0A9E7SX29_9EURY|nr:cupin domain-containing protein [Natronosalvus rutilus]UTF55752.1 cupin domain-containing protein [Natronosalvus rutilus]
MRIEYDSDPTYSLEERPKASVVRFNEVTPATRHSSDVGCNFKHLVWRYEFHGSQWFDGLELLKVDPGTYTDFLSHREDVEGPLERVLRVFSGRAVIRTEHWDEPLERFDHVAVPTGAAYQLGNTGVEPLWVGSWYSTGGNGASPETMLEPADRTGARAEYERIMAVRDERGLSTPPGDDGDDVDSPNVDRPDPTVEAFADAQPKTRYEAPEVGCNADWLAWMTNFDVLEWISDSSVMKLEPGGYTSLHTHFDNEGPHEELYWVMAGEARLVTEYRDERLCRFDSAFFPTGNPHAIGNVGTDTLWVGAWGARGGIEGEFDVSDLEISDRPGQTQEYERVMAARKHRGLSLPPNVEVDDA